MEDYDDIAESFDKFAEDTIKPNTTELTLGISPAISNLELTGTETVLDYGGAAGRIARLIAPKTSQIYVADISKEELSNGEKAGTEEGKLKFKHIESGSIPLPEKTFDAGMLNFVMCHINQGEAQKVLSEIRRTMKKGARVVLLNNNWDEGAGEIFGSTDLKTIDPKPFDNVETGLLDSNGKEFLTVNECYWTANNLTDSLESSGFELIKLVKEKALPNKYNQKVELEIAPYMIHVVEAI